jgi:hypothetical protein
MYTQFQLWQQEAMREVGRGSERSNSNINAVTVGSGASRNEMD